VPRPEFKTATFREGVERLEDLREGMILEGVVTNVTNFGAFVDIGVHQDGLVHISEMADRFVKDPREVSKPGDIVKVRVQEVDIKRRRVGLSMKLQKDSSQGPRPGQGGGGTRPGTQKPQKTQQKEADGMGALAAAFARAKGQ
jgi:uncharacterized protein